MVFSEVRFIPLSRGYNNKKFWVWNVYFIVGCQQSWNQARSTALPKTLFDVKIYFESIWIESSFVLYEKLKVELQQQIAGFHQIQGVQSKQFKVEKFWCWEL